MNEANIELLDDFAAAAMVGMLSNPEKGGPNSKRYIALEAYDMAFEMVKARAERLESIEESK